MATVVNSSWIFLFGRSAGHHSFRTLESRRCLHLGRCVYSPRRADTTKLRSDKLNEAKIAAAGQALADMHTRKWQLVSAVCVERSPVVSAAKTKAEEDFAAILSQQEFEQSLLSDHELSKLADAKKAKKKTDLENLADEEIVMDTAQDREDNWNEQLIQFKPASRTTEADESGDLKSANRRLDRKLFLATNQILGETPRWIFPQGPWQAGESMRDTAQRVLRSTCGDQLHVSFLGSAPCGFYKYKYPSESKISKEFYGAKVFFFKALLDVKRSTMEPSKDVADYKWLTREELEACFKAEYYKQVDKFVFEFSSVSLPAEAKHEDLVRLKY